MELLYYVSWAIFTFAVFTNAYNFENSYYNQFLVADLEEMHSLDTTDYATATAHSRIRRDDENASGNEKCGKKRFKMCCESDFKKNFRDDVQDLKKECFKELIARDKPSSTSPIDPLKCDRPDKHRNDITCIMQCISEKRNIVDEAGNIKIEEFTALVRKSVRDEWAIPLLDNIITKCVEETPSTINKTQNSGSCNPASLKAEFCIFREIQINCPENKIKDPEVCAKFKNKIKKNEHELKFHDDD